MVNAIAAVNGTLTAFFKPFVKQSTNPTKRPLSEENTTEHARRRSKSPRVSKENVTPLAIRTDSPNAKRVGSPLAVLQQNINEEPSSELSALTPSDSDQEETIIFGKPQDSPRKSSFTQQSSGNVVSQSFTSSISSSSRRIQRYGETIITGSDGSDSDELWDLDEFLGRKSVNPVPVQQPVRQGRSTGKCSNRVSVVKQVDTSKDDEAKFKKLMEKTKLDFVKTENSRKAIQLAKELEMEDLKSLACVRSDRKPIGVITEDIISRLGDTDPEEAERFAQVIERTELTNTSYNWSFFDNKKTRSSVRSQERSRRHKTSLRESNVILLCSECGEDSPNSEDSVLVIVCKECQVPQHRSCSCILKDESEKQDFQYTCNACEKSQEDFTLIGSLHKQRKSRLNLRWPEIKDQPGWSVYCDTDERELALVGGVFEQAAADGLLPEELCLWILGQSFSEPNAHLRQAWQMVLSHANKSISSSQAFTYLQLGLKELGASEEAINSSDPIRKSPADPFHLSSFPIPRKALKTWLQIVGQFFDYTSSQDRARLLDQLLLLTLDSAIPLDTSIQSELQRVLADCIESFEDSDSDIEAINESFLRLFHRAGDVQFRLQCINILPAHTEKLSRLQRRLALATFYENPSHLKNDPAPTFLQDIRQYLHSDKQFHMTSKTDYRKIAVLFACLDIGIGIGNAPDSTDPSSVKDFNAAVDQLVKIMQVKYAKIQAHGAAHISRTESKDTLEAMERRLTYAVRTRQKRKHNIYDQPTLDGIFRKQ